MTHRKRVNKYTTYGTGKKTDMIKSVPSNIQEMCIDNEWKERYSVTVHAIIRYAQRVVKYYHTIDDTLKHEIAQVISTELKDKLHPLISGKFPLLGDYIAVVVNGIVITIKFKEKT